MTDVKQMYDNLVKQGYSKKDAAKVAQAKTGYSLVTQQPIKAKKTGRQYGKQEDFF